ncbi:DUF4382 domain-containing protein [Halobaculum gomorrense]|uniref:DUF4382 domain-containing protein n=1 Tax=Halobaculum gomorrense TaxID=43928 RepID=A0A1M5SYD4_9EURY|nr:DUF4382 domain-containing protein [Halobaculum gomorrense]SHH43472.1 protein of unknown function [Halobaculum gomorrense]
MTRHTTGWAAAAAALMLVLAGCAGGVTAPGTERGASTASGDDGGTVNFYISDQQNAIDQFEHLNVTITQVTLVQADGDDESETESTENTTTETATPESDDADDGGQVTYQVDNITVDLTELQGANASKLGSVPVPNGTYTKVFVEVSSVNGTLTDGSSADVKLPSNKLQLNTDFTVSNGEAVDFVFDVTVFERGPNGYILKPVASESGTGDEVEIRAVGDRGESGDGGADNEESGDDAGGESDRGGNASDGASGQSSMDFYLSDEQNAMGDFAHLNVTVTKVGIHEANGSWIEKDVADQSVDLTTLQGANATKLGTFGVENDTYDKVFVYVDGIDATLENGDSANVKLPSSKLQLHTEFTVGDGEEIDFVYDMSVFKAGKSGKYILKPVVSESGTGEEVAIEDIDERETESETEGTSENGSGDAETEIAALNASFVGNVSAGANATVEVTRNGSAVENATVVVTQTADGNETSETYTTDANGTVAFAVDANATTLTVEVTDADGEVELEREFEGEAMAGGSTETSAGSDDAGAGGDDSAALRSAAV